MFEELIKYYLFEFHIRGETALKDICNLVVPTKIVLEEYKKFLPIELLPDKDKKELKQYVIELFPEKTIAEKVICCKVIYTMGSLI